jgi:hypothetical protein
MRSFTLKNSLIVSMLLVGAFALTRGTAAASPDNYRAGMPGLITDVKVWVQDVEMTLDASLAKPELACDAHAVELAHRGEWITADLVGTGGHAPAALAASHTALAGSMAAMTDAVETACGGSVGALAAVQAQKAGQNRAMFRISNFVNGSFTGNGGR